MEKITKIFFIFGFIFLLFVCCGGAIELPHSNDITKLNTVQIIRKFGYPAETHTVQTTDGYILEMHRIPSQNDQKTGTKKPPVYMFHGLFGSSMDFFVNGTKFALPFLLSDLGFDVWLGNVRGNSYSKRHVSLSPKDLKFWNFTWHETAIYDTPAQIDYICDVTKQEKVVFVGFSLGATVFFVFASSLPKYNDKIEVAMLMAPVAYLKHTQSPLLRFLAPFSWGIYVATELMTAGEFLPKNPTLTHITRIACESSWTQRRICMNMMFQLSGFDSKEFDETSFANVLSLYPQGYSSKGVNHYVQLVKSGKFRQYDYGLIGNYRHYGSLHPPEYNLSAIRVPMYFYQGKNDYLSDMRDLEHLTKELSTLRKTYTVGYPSFTHMGFMVSLDPKGFVYDELLKDLMSYLNEAKNSK